MKFLGVVWDRQKSVAFWVSETFADSKYIYT